MVAVPAGLPVGTAAGRFLFVSQDKADADTSADYTVVSGTVKFTCSAKVPLQVQSQSLVLVPREFYGEFDSEGYLVPVGGNPGVRGIELPASDSTVYNPSGFTWKVTFELRDIETGNAIKVPSMNMFITTGVVNQMSDQLPLGESLGTMQIRGEKGEAGDMIPVAASQNVGTVVHTLTLAMLPSTRHIVLTGNPTLSIPTPPVEHRSGTITLCLKQDATGGRTMVWPATVKWPEAIVQQPAAAANALSVFHLTWTGQEWIGLLGGKSFA